MSSEFDVSRFFTYSLDMLCIAGFDGYFKCINPAFEHKLGWSLKELTAQPFISFVHPADLVKTEFEIEKLRRGEFTQSFENRYRHKDGSWVWMLWTSYPDHETQLLYAVARDITERKERELRQDTELVTALSKLETLSELVPICSHCKKIRNDEGFWNRIELYLLEKVDQRLTHSICPCCAEREFGCYLQRRHLP